jgi:hypothetical protein
MLQWASLLFWILSIVLVICQKKKHFKNCICFHHLVKAGERGAYSHLLHCWRLAVSKGPTRVDTHLPCLHLMVEIDPGSKLWVFWQITRMMDNVQKTEEQLYKYNCINWYSSTVMHHSLGSYLALWECPSCLGFSLSLLVEKYIVLYMVIRKFLCGGTRCTVMWMLCALILLQKNFSVTLYFTWKNCGPKLVSIFSTA